MEKRIPPHNHTKSDLDALRCMYWASYVRHKLKASNWREVEDLVAPAWKKAGKGEAGSCNSGAWYKYGRGLHNPTKRTLTLVERSVEGSFAIFHSVLWDVLKHPGSSREQLKDQATRIDSSTAGKLLKPPVSSARSIRMRRIRRKTENILCLCTLDGLALVLLLSRQSQLDSDPKMLRQYQKLAIDIVFTIGAFEPARPIREALHLATAKYLLILQRGFLREKEQAEEMNLLEILKEIHAPYGILIPGTTYDELCKANDGIVVHSERLYFAQSTEQRIELLFWANRMDAMEIYGTIHERKEPVSTGGNLVEGGSGMLGVLDYYRKTGRRYGFWGGDERLIFIDQEAAALMKIDHARMNLGLNPFRSARPRDKSKFRRGKQNQQNGKEKPEDVEAPNRIRWKTSTAPPVAGAGPRFPP